MPLDFPSNPTPNQTYTYSNKTWQWNGQAWVIVSATQQTIAKYVETVNGITGPVGLSGSSSITITKDGKTLIFTSLGGGIVGNYVEEINGVTGGITFSAGSGISISSSAKLFTVTNTGVRTINGFTGNVGFSAGAGITLIRSGVTFIISSLGTPTVNAITSINSMDGPDITIAGGDSIGVSSTSNTVTVFNRGVTSINGLTGIVGLSAGRGISLFGSGRTLTIENFGVVSINGITSNVGLSAASSNVTIGTVGRTMTISVSGGAASGVSSLSTLTGAVTATGEGAIIAPLITGGVDGTITFRTRLGQMWNGVTGATGVNNYICSDFYVTKKGTLTVNSNRMPTEACIASLYNSSEIFTDCLIVSGTNVTDLCDGNNEANCSGGAAEDGCRWIRVWNSSQSFWQGKCVCARYRLNSNI